MVVDGGAGVPPKLAQNDVTRGLHVAENRYFADDPRERRFLGKGSEVTGRVGRLGRGSWARNAFWKRRGGRKYEQQARRKDHGIAMCGGRTSCDGPLRKASENPFSMSSKAR